LFFFPPFFFFGIPPERERETEGSQCIGLLFFPPLPKPYREELKEVVSFLTPFPASKVCQKKEDLEEASLSPLFFFFFLFFPFPTLIATKSWPGFGFPPPFETCRFSKQRRPKIVDPFFSPPFPLTFRYELFWKTLILPPFFTLSHFLSFPPPPPLPFSDYRFFFFSPFFPPLLEKISDLAANALLPPPNPSFPPQPHNRDIKADYSSFSFSPGDFFFSLLRLISG